mmetsp:Transcript_78569/g.218148  ORF Transcript_78569/g.218148 Transcript_78569/m.218148 type:complete len:230 (+) Transcript_78569:400-1089(+)
MRSSLIWKATEMLYSSRALRRLNSKSNRTTRHQLIRRNTSRVPTMPTLRSHNELALPAAAAAFASATFSACLVSSTMPCALTVSAAASAISCLSLPSSLRMAASLWLASSWYRLAATSEAFNLRNASCLAFSSTTSWRTTRLAFAFSASSARARSSCATSCLLSARIRSTRLLHAKALAFSSPFCASTWRCCADRNDFIAPVKFELPASVIACAITLFACAISATATLT